MEGLVFIEGDLKFLVGEGKGLRYRVTRAQHGRAFRRRGEQGVIARQVWFQNDLVMDSSSPEETLRRPENAPFLPLSRNSPTPSGIPRKQPQNGVVEYFEEGEG